MHWTDFSKNGIFLEQEPRQAVAADQLVWRMAAVVSIRPPPPPLFLPSSRGGCPSSILPLRQNPLCKCCNCERARITHATSSSLSKRRQMGVQIRHAREARQLAAHLHSLPKCGQTCGGSSWRSKCLLPRGQIDVWADGHARTAADPFGSLAKYV